MEKPKKANITAKMPSFLCHIDFDIQQGRMPFMHGKKDYIHGWMRYKKPPQKFNYAHLIALIDAWPCTVLQQLELPAPASTMNWNLEFPQVASAVKPDQWLAYQSTTAHASDGYA